MVLFLGSIAGSEIIVILLFILIFFGAKSIPGMSRSLGRGIRQIKDASQEIQDEIRKTTGDMKKDLDLNRSLNQTIEDVQGPIRKAISEVDKEASQINRTIVSREYKNKVSPPLPPASPSLKKSIPSHTDNQLDSDESQSINPPQT
jgi:sec-independent protein translocase protein TatA